MDKSILEFSVNIYGQVEKFNQVLSKARCRIFYKYGNRNGTYITDEFAERLLSTLPYSPVKGIYEYDDYTDHGTRRSEGRIYGIVPQDPNIAWETHLDEDGVEREYACADVLIFTALYQEALEVVGKGQSMELYEPSIKYHKEVIKGQQFIVFDEGCFLGLQVLGDDVEPCFEGASFYSLQSSIEQVIKKLEEVSKTYTNKGGKLEMPKLNFKLSDDQKYSALWSLLNSQYNEEGEWAISYTITDVFDDYALAFNYEDMTYERIYYKKNDENDSVEITEKKKVYVMDITENEKNTIDTLRQLNGGTYELVAETLMTAEEIAQKNSEFSTKIEELEAANATLNTDKVNSDNLYTEAQSQIEALNSELNELKEYRHTIETQQKESVIAEYEEQLSEEVINEYKANLDNYTVTDLDMRLAYELKKSNPAIFSKKSDNGYVPKDEQTNALDEILSKYKK